MRENAPIVKEVRRQEPLLLEQILQLSDFLRVLLVDLGAVSYFGQVVGEDVEELLSGILLYLLHLDKLLITFFFAHELRRHRVGEDEDPGWQEKFATRNQQKEGEGHKLDEIFADLTYSLLLMEC